jgi:AcrR family transcriptional regulator
VTATKRLTRAESRERTRTAIVDAATTLFLRDGYGTTSLEQVASAAGFTIGAVYSNFESKAALGNAVIDALYAREQRKLEAIEHKPGSDAWFAALTSWAEDTIGDPCWTRLELEIAASEAGDRTATAARYARLRRRCAALIGDLGPDAARIDPEPLATAVVGLALGIGAQRAADPSISGAVFSEALRALAGRRSATRAPEVLAGRRSDTNRG